MLGPASPSSRPFGPAARELTLDGALTERSPPIRARGRDLRELMRAAAGVAVLLHKELARHASHPMVAWSQLRRLSPRNHPRLSIEGNR